MEPSDREEARQVRLGEDPFGGRSDWGKICLLRPYSGDPAAMLLSWGWLGLSLFNLNSVQMELDGEPRKDSSGQGWSLAKGAGLWRFMPAACRLLRAENVTDDLARPVAPNCRFRALL